MTLRTMCGPPNGTYGSTCMRKKKHLKSSREFETRAIGNYATAIVLSFFSYSIHMVNFGLRKIRHFSLTINYWNYNWTFFSFYSVCFNHRVLPGECRKTDQ